MSVSEIRNNDAVNSLIASPPPGPDGKASVKGNDGNGRSLVWEKAAAVVGRVDNFLEVVVRKFAAAGKIIGAAIGGAVAVATLGFAPKMLDRVINDGNDHSPSSKGYFAACKRYFAGCAMIGGWAGEGVGKFVGEGVCIPVGAAGIVLSVVAAPVLAAVDYVRSPEREGYERVADDIPLDVLP